MYAVTLVDVRSTQEHPIAPKTIVIEESKICDVIAEKVDENHYVMVAAVQTDF